MKAYVVTTGSAFALLALVHVARAAPENPRLAFDPVFVALTLACGGLAVWAWRVYRRLPR